MASDRLPLYTLSPDEEISGKISLRVACGSVLEWLVARRSQDDLIWEGYYAYCTLCMGRECLSSICMQNVYQNVWLTGRVRMCLRGSRVLVAVLLHKINEVFSTKSHTTE